jgi:hypothetical protein
MVRVAPGGLAFSRARSIGVGILGVDLEAVASAAGIRRVRRRIKVARVESGRRQVALPSEAKDNRPDNRRRCQGRQYSESLQGIASSAERKACHNKQTITVAPEKWTL